MKIDIVRHEPGYTLKCLICSRILSDRYYELHIEYTDDGFITNMRKEICLDCNLTLQRHYRRDVD